MSRRDQLDAGDGLTAPNYRDPLTSVFQRC
jgi:hypothetical protein